MLRTAIHTISMFLDVLIAVVAISIQMTMVGQDIRFREVLGHSTGNTLVEHAVNVVRLWLCITAL